MKKSVVLLLLIALVSLLAADVYTIGTGTSTQNYIPFYGLYDYGWSKVIYTAAELSAAGLEAGQIDGIGFEVGNTPSNYVAVDQRVFLRHTTTSEYATTDNTLPDNTQFQNVYYANYTWNGSGWHNILFSAPFIWDGTSNIEILWENWDGDYASGPNFRYTTTNPVYQAVYKYADNAFPTTAGTRTYSRPNLRVLTPDLDPPNPAIAINPMDMSTAFGTSATLSWTAGAGPVATGFDLYFGDTNPPAYVGDMGIAMSYPVSGLDNGATYYWQVVPYNANGSARDCPVWSFNTPGENQLVESFEATTVPPTGWAFGSSGSWYRTTTYKLHGTASVYKSGSTTTQYLVSTPMLTIDENSSLDFWAAGSSTTASLEIVYSSDRVNWTQIGDTIVHPGSYTFMPYSYDLSSLAGNSYYLGFRTGLTSGSTYLDAVVGPDITPLAPGAPSLTAPSDLATNVNEYPTFSWTAPTTGGIPTSYDLYLDTVDGSTPYAEGVSSPYTLSTPLDYETTYYWTVVAKNGAGGGDPAVVRSFTTRANPTISTFPYTVDFSTWPALNWQHYNHIYGQTPILGGSNWGQDDWCNITSPVNKAAKINIYATHNAWIVSAPIQIPDTGYELKFDLALMVWNSQSTAVTPGNQADDRFLVVISDNPDMSNPTTLMEWNNTGSANVFDNIPPAGSTYTINLDSYVGTKYFGFYAESLTDTAGDNDLMVDNVIVRETPANPVFAVDPESWAFGDVDINGPAASKTFTISNAGAGTLEVTGVDVTGDYYYLGDAPEFPQFLTLGDTAEFTVHFGPEMVGPFDGLITINTTEGGKSKAAHTVELTGSGWVIPAGSTCDNPYPVELPLEGFTGDTGLYGDDYESGWVSPSFNYLGGDDMVLQFSLAEKSNLIGTLTATNGTWIGMVLTQEAPNATTPVATYGRASSGSGAVCSFSGVVLDPGTYFLIISTWPTPQAVEFSLDLSSEIYFDVPANTPTEVATGVDIESGINLNINPAIDETNEVVVSLPNYDDMVDPVVIGLTGTGVTDLVFTVGAGTWYGTLYVGGTWYQGNPYPLVGPGTITFAGVDFDAKGDVIVVLSEGSDPTLPVELSSFTAVLTGDMYVQIAWVAESETNHSGYNILRSESMDMAEAIKVNATLIDEGSNLGSQISYSFIDSEAYINMQYYYWLESVALDGVVSHYGPLTVTIGDPELDPVAPTIPKVTTLHNAFPNPFNPSTTIGYYMAEAGNVDIQIYNLRGQLMKSFTATHADKGPYYMSWDGRDTNGQPVGSGIYLYRMTSGNYSSTKKMVLSK